MTTVSGIQIHDSIDIDRVMDLAADDDCKGICLKCGETADGVEPDAEHYTCECCDEQAVFGAEILLIHLGS